MNNKSELLGIQPVAKLLTRLSLPAMTAMLVLSFYNIADTIFVGQTVGAAAIGGLGIVFPLQMLFMAVGFFFGIGGASLYSRALGAGEQATAGTTLGNTLFGAATAGIALMILALLTREPVLHLFGAREAELSRYAKEYYSIIILGIPLISLLVAGNNNIRAAGHAKTAMFTMLISPLLNITLDPILIIGFKMGVKGAALATVISQGISVLCLFFYFRSRHAETRLYLKQMRPHGRVLKEIAAVGISSFARQAAQSAMLAVFNNLFLNYGGSAAVSIFGTTFRPLSLAIMPLFGLAQALQPIAGYNYGAGKLQRVRHAFGLSCKISTGIATVSMLLFVIFPEPIIRIFIKREDLIKNPQLIPLGVEMIRYLKILFPLAGYQIMAAALFQALGRSGPAFLTSISRQLLFLIPMGLVLPHFQGLQGVLAAFPAAEALGFILTLFLIGKERRLLRPQSA